MRIDEVMGILEDVNCVECHSDEWFLLRDYFSEMINAGICNDWGLYDFCVSANNDVKYFDSFEEALKEYDEYSEFDILAQSGNAVLMNP